MRDSNGAILIRRLAETDSVEDLTELLHRAYAGLNDMGLRYWATYQTAEDTRLRISKGECWVAEADGRIVATILLIPPGSLEVCDWYSRRDVSIMSQFGVDPDRQRGGIGSQLMTRMEQRAKELGAMEVAVDTAEPAEHLVRMYEKRGYRPVERVKWEHTNYTSVILSKRLTDT